VSARTVYRTSAAPLFVGFFKGAPWTALDEAGWNATLDIRWMSAAEVKAAQREEMAMYRKEMARNSMRSGSPV
jgi:hypothetical protein